jgi:hypothetical protein
LGLGRLSAGENAQAERDDDHVARRNRTETHAADCRSVRRRVLAENLVQAHEASLPLILLGGFQEAQKLEIGAEGVAHPLGVFFARLPLGVFFARLPLGRALAFHGCPLLPPSGLFHVCHLMLQPQR